MLKKILFSLLSFLMVYSICVAAFRIFEPDTEPVGEDTSSFISYASLKEYIVSSGESSEHFLFFYNPLDADSVYVRTSVIPDVESKTDLDLSSMIETVDLSGVLVENLPTSLASDWGLSDYPAFALVGLRDGEIVIESTLQSSSTTPITTPVLTQWLKDNDMYQSN
ncbi:MAG: hypothetical protein ACI32N_03005 [Bulleidia sp.]